MFFLNHIWLIPLLPALGAAVMLCFGRRLQKATIDAVCVGVVVLAFLFACFTVVEYTHFAHGTGRPFEKVLYTWLGSGDGHLKFVKRDATLASFNGDAGFLLGALTLSWYLGSFRFTDVNTLARSGHFAIGDPVLTAAALLLFVGACGKSAQLPLHVWLPDAMEGPTPVSALIHAATMGTAGVYMVARSNAVFVLAPTAMKTVAIVGALSAAFARSP